MCSDDDETQCSLDMKPNLMQPCNTDVCGNLTILVLKLNKFIFQLLQNTKEFQAEIVFRLFVIYKRVKCGYISVTLPVPEKSRCIKVNFCTELFEKHHSYLP